MKSKKNLAIIGIGRWGKNLLRGFNKIADVWHCYYHGNPENSKWLKKNYPDIKVAGSYNEIFKNPKIDAVIIATPIATHYELTKKALLAGKDVFVEKPITNNVKQAQELVKLAAKKKRVLFVGHIFSYHPVLAKIKQVARKEPLKYAAFVWNKFGTFDEELIYNLLSHDVATTLDLFGQPTSIKTLENRGLATSSDIIYTRLNFKNNRSCTIYINRVSNQKNKTVTLVTAKNIYLWENDKLLGFNPVRGRGTLRALAASFGVDLNKNLNKNDFGLIYRSTKTPLEIECAEFIKCLKQNKRPRTSGEFGLEVVKILSKI